MGISTTISIIPQRLNEQLEENEPNTLTDLGFINTKLVSILFDLFFIGNNTFGIFIRSPLVN